MRGQLAYHLDGLLLAFVRGASATREAALELWQTESNTLAQSIALGNLYGINALAFSPDGHFIATGAHATRPITIWPVAGVDATDAQPQELGAAGSTSPSTRLAFTLDGSQIFATDENAVTTLYSRTPPQTMRSPRATDEFTQQERQAYAIDTFVGPYPLSDSSNVNLRQQPFVISLIAQPSATGVPTQTLIALTNDRFLLLSTNRGESWRVSTRLPLTMTYSSLGIPARPSDPLLITTDHGLYRVDRTDDITGAFTATLTLIHSDALIGVSYSHTDPNELWAIRGNQIVKSEDGGETWGGASANLGANRIYAPLLITPPNNNPQLVTIQPQDSPVRTVWRGTGNGFWERLAALPPLPNGLTDEQGMAWDAENRTLYLGGAKGELFASTLVDESTIEEVTATLVEQFGPGTRPIPLAVGQGPSLYLTLLTPTGPLFLRGTWDGNTWHWVELRLPLVAAG